MVAGASRSLSMSPVFIGSVKLVVASEMPAWGAYFVVLYGHFGRFLWRYCSMSMVEAVEFRAYQTSGLLWSRIDLILYQSVAMLDSTKFLVNDDKGHASVSHCGLSRCTCLGYGRPDSASLVSMLYIFC